MWLLDFCYDPTLGNNATCTENGFMVQAQYCSKWSELRDSTFVNRTTNHLSVRGTVNIFVKQGICFEPT